MRLLPKSVLAALSVVVALIACTVSGVAQTPPPAVGPSHTYTQQTMVSPAAELSLTDAIILGVIEGVTEFLPISSTGHLVIANQFLGLTSTTPLVGPDGEQLWHKRPSEKNPDGEPLTIELAATTYAVVLQFGAIAAVALMYWSQFMAMLRGLLGRDPAGLRLFFYVVIASIPAAVLGLLFNDVIDSYLSSIGVVIIAQFAGAGLMLYAEAWRKKRDARRGDAPEAELTVKSAATIGLMQCAALWPGTSRSMMTIVGGYFVGLDPRRAAEFSFLLGFVTLTGAAMLKSYKSGGAMIEVFGWTNVLLGGVVAAVTAAICVRFLVRWLTKYGLALFAWYRIALALVLAVVFYL